MLFPEDNKSHMSVEIFDTKTQKICSMIYGLLNRKVFKSSRIEEGKIKKKDSYKLLNHPEAKKHFTRKNVYQRI